MHSILFSKKVIQNKPYLQNWFFQKCVQRVSFFQKPMNPLFSLKIVIFLNFMEFSIIREQSLWNFHPRKGFSKKTMGFSLLNWFSKKPMGFVLMKMIFQNPWNFPLENIFPKNHVISLPYFFPLKFFFLKLIGFKK